MEGREVGAGSWLALVALLHCLGEQAVAIVAGDADEVMVAHVRGLTSAAQQHRTFPWLMHRRCFTQCGVSFPQRFLPTWLTIGGSRTTHRGDLRLPGVR